MTNKGFPFPALPAERSFHSAAKLLQVLTDGLIYLQSISSKPNVWCSVNDSNLLLIFKPLIFVQTVLSP